MLTTPQPKQPDSWMIPVAIILLSAMLTGIGYLLYTSFWITLIYLGVTAIICFVCADGKGSEDE